MTNTYLLEVIKAFQPKERQEMASFLLSDHYNRGKNAQEIVRLYKTIVETAPDFSEELLNKDRVCVQVFSEPDVIPGRLEKVISDLNKLLRTFALTRQYFAENNEEQQQIDWAKWLRTNGIAEPAQKTILKLKNKKESVEAESMDQYRTGWLISEEEHLWELTHNQVKGDLNIPNLIYRLDLFYHNYRTELGNRYLLQQKAAQLPDKDFSETEANSFLSDSILLQISKKIYDVLKNGLPSVEETQGLMVLLRRYESTLSFQALDHFYAYLRNFCTFLINGGHLDFIPVLHQTNKDNLEREYFFINGKLPPHAYLNMVQISIRAKDHEWAKEFTERYKSQIVDGDEGRFFYRLNMAYCLFAEGNFDEALNQMPEAPSTAHYHRMVRRLEIKIYYEMRSDLLLYKMDAFRKFLVRTATKTIAANLRTMDLNLLNILMQLTQTPMKDKVRSARLVTRIEGKKLLTDRAWLLEKARERG